MVQGPSRLLSSLVHPQGHSLDMGPLHRHSPSQTLLSVDIHITSQGTQGSSRSRHIFFSAHRHKSLRTNSKLAVTPRGLSRVLYPDNFAKHDGKHREGEGVPHPPFLWIAKDDG